MGFNYLAAKQRMLNKLGKNCDGKDCELCPLQRGAIEHDNSCTVLEAALPYEATEIVRKWDAENPQKMRLDVFLEAFPGTPLMENGTPLVCCRNIGLDNREICDGDCVDCWGTEVEK